MRPCRRELFSRRHNVQGQAEEKLLPAQEESNQSPAAVKFHFPETFQLSATYPQRPSAPDKASAEAVCEGFLVSAACSRICNDVSFWRIELSFRYLTTSILLCNLSKKALEMPNFKRNSCYCNASSYNHSQEFSNLP